jgi:hypothetical protein
VKKTVKCIFQLNTHDRITFANYLDTDAKIIWNKEQCALISTEEDIPQDGLCDDCDDDLDEMELDVKESEQGAAADKQ